MVSLEVQAELVVMVEVVVMAGMMVSTTKAITRLFLENLVKIILSILKFPKHLSAATNKNFLDTTLMLRLNVKCSTFALTTKLTIFCALMAQSSIKSILFAFGGTSSIAALLHPSTT